MELGKKVAILEMGMVPKFGPQRWAENPLHFQKPFHV